MHKKFLRLSGLIIIIMLCSSFMMAQVSVTGRVTGDDDGQGLPGVNIMVKGTATGTVTDGSGSFRITAPSAESILV